MKWPIDRLPDYLCDFNDWNLHMYAVFEEENWSKISFLINNNGRKVEKQLD